MANTGKLEKYMLDDAKYGPEIQIDFERLLREGQHFKSVLIKHLKLDIAANPPSRGIGGLVDAF